jgi:hypothetical protein
MKRAARIFATAPILCFSLLMPLVPRAAFGEAASTAAVLSWVNHLRERQGLAELGPDPLLERAAEAYAVDLRDRGVLSHVDDQGRRALQRVQALGGTAVLVGELLGSGTDLRSVSAAWEASPGHREVVLNPLWTHCGAATVKSGATAVWVVLFTSRRIDPLQILRSAEGYLIRGRLASPRAEEPVLLSGIEPVDPLHWDARSREFAFLVPLDREEIYCRLGYRLRSEQGGGLVVTDTFYPRAAAASAALTSDLEREFR